MTTNRRSGAFAVVWLAVVLPLLVAVVVMAGRVGDPARFVTWPVVAFTVMAATVALLGLWTGLPRPWLLGVGVFPALVLAYTLPAAPLPVAVVVLMCLGGLAVAVRGVAAGLAAAAGALMVLLVVLQGTAVRCGQSSISADSGPWWIASPSSSSGGGSANPDGSASGTTQVGAHHYAYSCVGGRLTRFERADG